MPYRKYSPAQKREAVALARVVGSDVAAEQLGMDPRAVRDWLGKAGDAPELAGDRATWRGLMDLALARTQALVAGGKLSPAQMATIAGIAARNAHRDVTEPEPETTPGERATDALVAWIEQHRGPEAVDLALAALLRADRLEHGHHPDAPDVPMTEEQVEPAVAQWIALIEPDVDAWLARLRAEEAARDAARVAPPYAVPPTDDLAALIAEADRILEEMTR